MAVGLRGNGGEEHGSNGDKAVLHDCGCWGFGVVLIYVFCCVCAILVIGWRFKDCVLRSVYLESYLFGFEGMCDHRYTGVEPWGRIR